MKALILLFILLALLILVGKWLISLTFAKLISVIVLAICILFLFWLFSDSD